MNRAINNLKLEAANVGKLKRLDEVASVYILAVQRLVNILIATGQRVPNKYGEIPGDEANLIGPPSPENQLSERWRRCAWQQACGIVKSWYANERTNPPCLNVEDICIQANANVVKLEMQGAPQRARLEQIKRLKTKGEAEGKVVRIPKTLPDPKGGRQFEYWLKVATLRAGEPIYLPVQLYPRAAKLLKSASRTASSVLLTRRRGEWQLQIVVEHQAPEPVTASAPAVVGIDVGIVNFATVSPTHDVDSGESLPETDQRPFHQSFGGIPDQLSNRVERDAERMSRKQKLNVCLEKKGRTPVSLTNPATTAWIRNLIGYALNQLLFWLPSPDSVVIVVETQAEFHCQHCHFQINADCNASDVIAKRFGDHQLNQLSVPRTGDLLLERFWNTISFSYGPSPTVPRSGMAGEKSFISRDRPLRQVKPIL
ncbi:MAG: hypothetical protein HY774_10565 [Acidobacteria bacterium]|nr:hypothetical protein [Acidobacteriota bacterium]